jgi:hypothetical protein
MDYYTVMFLNPTNGNRILMDGVTADVKEVGGIFDTFPSVSGHFKKKTVTQASRLNIILEIQNTDHDQLEKIKAEIMMDEVLIYFKDTHPNLIKGRVTGMAIDSKTTTIRFVGNITDKTYYDFAAEVTNKLNAQQINWTQNEFEDEFIQNGFPDLTQPDDPIDDSIVHPPEPKNKRKAMVLKRKLTFK